MNGQSLYYLNNKKYITNVTNIGTVVNELNSFYHTGNARDILVVNSSNTEVSIINGEFTALAESIRSGAGDYLAFAEFADTANSAFIQNSDKYIIAFTDESDMLNVFSRYTAGLLDASGFYENSNTSINEITADYVEAIIEADVMLTFMNESEVLNNARQYCLDTLSNSDTPAFDITYQDGKNFSYDLLFFLNDNYPCDGVKNLIVEKFTIHSSVMAQDVMEHFTSRRHYTAYLLSVIDWMNANATDSNNYATDKQEFFKEVYVNAANSGNYTLAFYKLEQLWNKVKDDPAFIAAHDAKVAESSSGWEYQDLYTEINNVFPIVKMVLESNYNMETLSEDLRMINSDVQFFTRRQNRIPYLIHKYPL